MTIQNLADAKKAIEELPNRQGGYVYVVKEDVLRIISELQTEILRQIDSVIENLESACANCPQEFWDDYNNRIKELKFARKIITGESK